uniref:Ig-like domain-containing protein n=1 Tax=Vombatus ursinus TaxID=29139 RepID=A0A4X2LMW5_VOMUR
MNWDIIDGSWQRINPLCLLFPAGASTVEDVIQAPASTSVQEGEAVTVNCKYETSRAQIVLFWYKQSLSGEMVPLIRQDSYNQENARVDRYSVILEKTEKSINLTISDSQLENSATYFCVLSDLTVRDVTGAAVQKHHRWA